MRQHAAHKEYRVIALYEVIRRKLLDIHSAEDNVRPRLVTMAADLAAVFADMQMAVVPAVGGDVRGDVPAAAAEVADEGAPARQPCVGGGGAARQDMLLMAVDHVGAAQLGDHPPRQRIMALASHVPGVAQHMNFQVPDAFIHFALAEAQQRGRCNFRHMPSKFVRIALTASDRAVSAEQRRHYMHDT
jgi:hypothetical protein